MNHPDQLQNLQLGEDNANMVDKTITTYLSWTNMQCRAFSGR